METKFCPKCESVKSTDEFGKKLNKWTSWCLECTREYDKNRYANNRETIRKRQNDSYPKRAAKQIAQQKQFLKDNPERGLLKLARQRCKKSGVLCTITEKDILIPEFCPILGVRLEFGDMQTRDNSPSLDRINPDLGYVPGNIAVLSYRANRIKNEGTADEHRRIADWMDAQKKDYLDERLMIKDLPSVIVEDIENYPIRMTYGVSLPPDISKCIRRIGAEVS